MIGTTAFGQVYYADLFGPRPEKYAFTAQAEMRDVAWKEIKPSSPFYTNSK